MAKVPKTKPAEPTPTLPPSAGKTEVGATGLRGAVPGQGWLYDEFIPELRGTRGMEKFKQMSENDPICSAMLYAIESLVRGVKWRVEPGEPPEGKTLSESKLRASAEFLEGALFEDMNRPFGDVVNEALTMLTYGFSLLEVVLKKRNGGIGSRFDDGYVGIAKLSPRSQRTIQRWLFDPSGELVGVEQLLEDGRGIVTLPNSKLLHFRTTTRLSNPEGRSVLRGAYVSWVRKNTIEESEGRVAARAGGVVEIRVPADLLDENAPSEIKRVRNMWQGIADRLAQDRQGSVLIPSDCGPDGKPLYELRFAIPESRRQSDLNSMVERYNKLIAMTVMADFLLLGHETVGSFALADSKTTMFARATGALLDIIAEQFNRVLIPNLWAWNGFDATYRPRLVHGDIENRDLAALGGFVQAMAAAGMPIFPDEATENYLREQAGLPARTEESGGGAQAQTLGQNGQPGQVAQGNGEPRRLGPGAAPEDEEEADVGYELATE